VALQLHLASNSRKRNILTSNLPRNSKNSRSCSSENSSNSESTQQSKRKRKMAIQQPRILNSKKREVQDTIISNNSEKSKTRSSKSNSNLVQEPDQPQSKPQSNTAASTTRERKIVAVQQPYLGLGNEDSDLKHDSTPDGCDSSSYIDGTSSQSIGNCDRGFNTIEIFGSLGIKDVFTFIGICKLFGVPIYTNSIESFKCRGYRSKDLDSRHLEITFRTNKAASKAEAALTYVEQLKEHFSKWRHQTSLKLSRKENYFNCVLDSESEGELADLSNIPESPEEKVRESPNLEEKVDEPNNDATISSAGQSQTSNLSIPETPSISHARFCTWNIQTLNGKIQALKESLNSHDIQVLGLTDTKWKDRDIDSYFSDYQWIGRKAETQSGGVGFLIHNSVLFQRKYEVINGTEKNSIFLL